MTGDIAQLEFNFDQSSDITEEQLQALYLWIEELCKDNMKMADKARKEYFNKLELLSSHQHQCP
jgi:hypothetical protein